MLLSNTAHIEWVHPWGFVLLGILPVLVYFQFFKKKRNYITFSNLSGIPSGKSLKAWASYLSPLLPIIALAFIIVALARPQKIFQEVEQKAEGIDIMLVIDLSSSMLSKDFEPDRLEASKKVATDFINKRKYDRIGLVAFSGESYTQCPLTSDHRILKEFLSNLKVGQLRDGTAIGDGLATGVNRLQQDSLASSQVVIFLTDGVNTVNNYVTPEVAIKLAKTLGVKVYTIGVGTNGYALAPTRPKRSGGFEFGMLPVEIDEALLTRIAQETEGSYFRATNLAALEQIYAQIDEYEKREITTSYFKTYTEYFHRFLMIGLLILLIHFILKKTILSTLP